MKISLRWKAFLFLSALMLLLGVTWIVMHNTLSTRYFDIVRHEYHQTHAQALQREMTLIAERIDLIAFLGSLEMYTDESLLSEESLWQSLMLDQDISFFAMDDGRIQIAHVLDAGELKRWRRWRQTMARRKDDSQAQILCDDTLCRIGFRRRTFTLDGHPVQVFWVQGLAPLLVDFNQLTGSDLAVVRDGDHPQVLMSSHFTRLGPWLAGHLSRISALRQPAVVAEAQRTWLIDPVATPALHSSHLRLVAIRDISDSAGLFQHTLQRSVLLLLGVWLLLQVVVGVWALRPIRQIERISQAVARMPRGEFDAARTLLQAPKNTFQDELDTLEGDTRRMVNQLANTTEQLMALAHFDPLTGLPNRTRFQQDLTALLQQRRLGAIAFVDVNRFKQINDVYGHQVGDAVLQEIARQLSRHAPMLRAQAYRLAGDEFTLLFRKPVDMASLRQQMQALVAALNGELVTEREERIQFDASVGVVLVSDALDEKKLLHWADIAMYKAKRQGGLKRWHLFDPAVDDDTRRVRDQLELVSELKQALQRDDGFEMVFQPIYRLAGDRLIRSHYEALLRFRNGVGEPVSPAQFIPVAERFGLIREIDQWVMRHVVTRLAQCPDLKLAVNLSAPTLQSPDVVDQLDAVQKEEGVAPQRLIVELTETAYIDSMEAVQRNLKALSDMGVEIALDDFGVGFSSFSYLSRLSIHYLKLDGSYIRDLAENSRHQAFVEGVVRIGHGFRMEVVAEFVENEAIVDWLRRLGVELGQGYGLGKPRSWSEVVAENGSPMNSPK